MLPSILRLWRHEIELQKEILERLETWMERYLIESNLLRYTASKNWLEELLGTSGKGTMEWSPVDNNEAINQSTTEIDITTGMDIDLPEPETYHTSFVKTSSQARSEPRGLMQTAKKHRWDDDYDTDEDFLQGTKRVRVSHY
jgi:hypothetical protein